MRLLYHPMLLEIKEIKPVTSRRLSKVSVCYRFFYEILLTIILETITFIKESKYERKK